MLALRSLAVRSLVVPAALAALALASGACAAREHVAPADSLDAATGGSSGAPAGAVPDDSASLARLYAQVHALAIADGCSRGGDCRVLPVGVKACGGPQEYVAYCAPATDSTRLAAAIAALDQAERAYNAKHQVVSNCMRVQAPVPALANGRCVGARGGAGNTAVP